MDRVGGGEAIAVVPLKPGTYLLRAEDSGGRAGPEVRVSTKGAQVLTFSPLGFLQADPGFVGTKSGLAASGTNLTLTTATAALRQKSESAPAGSQVGTRQSHPSNA
jgi:hypothetical protein